MIDLPVSGCWIEDSRIKPVHYVQIMDNLGLFLSSGQAKAGDSGLLVVPAGHCYIKPDQVS
jgi:hypothetical protein